MTERNMAQKGYFLFSLDTELGIGHFDFDKKRHTLFSQDGVIERRRIQAVLSMCEKYDIHATWAIVGHIFFSKCEYCDHCLLKHWQGKFDSYEEAYGTNHPLWYGADVVKMIQNASVTQEIGFHGHTHEPFDLISADQAQLEVDEWKRVAERFEIKASSVVFPRDRIEHLGLLHNNGYQSYRKEMVMPWFYQNRFLGRFVKTMDHIVGISTAPSYPLEANYDQGMLRLPASQHLFGFNRGVDQILNRMGFKKLRIRRIIRGIKRAAEEGRMFHLWAHPWEFSSEGDMEKLDAIFSAVDGLVSVGQIESVTMEQMADILECET